MGYIWQTQVKKIHMLTTQHRVEWHLKKAGFFELCFYNDIPHWFYHHSGYQRGYLVFSIPSWWKRWKPIFRVERVLEVLKICYTVYENTVNLKWILGYVRFGLNGYGFNDSALCYALWSWNTIVHWYLSSNKSNNVETAYLIRFNANKTSA